MVVAKLKQWLQADGDTPLVSVKPELHVLMVCMGNICRSPTAEGVLRAKLARAGLKQRVAVDSAGTHGYHTGEAPDPRAIKHAAKRGYDIGTLKARPVAPADFERFDLLLAMDGDNLSWLLKRAPAAAQPRLGLLMAHAQRFGGAQVVPDPYYGTGEGFEQVLDLVEDACDGLVAHLQNRLASRGSPAQ